MLQSLRQRRVCHDRLLHPGEDQEGLVALWQAVATCQTQRLDVLHERLLHLEYSLPAVPTDHDLPANQPTPAAGTAGAAGELEAGHPVPAQLDVAEGEAAEEAPPPATLKQRTCEELGQVANGLTGLCMLNDMARMRSAPDDTSPDALPGIGEMVKHYHSHILRHAGILVKQTFLTSLLGGAARQQRLQRLELGRTPHGSSEWQSSAGASPRLRNEAPAAGISFSPAAQQLLNGQDFWETAEFAERWPRALAGKLQAACTAAAQSWLDLTAEDDTNSESASQPLQPPEVAQPGGGMSAGPKAHLEACLDLLQQISVGEMSSMHGYEPANKVHAEALECAKQAAGAVSVRAAMPQMSEVPVSMSMADGLAAAEGLIRLLCSVPVRWLDRHAFETWNLMNIALAVQSLLLKLSAVYGEQMSPYPGPGQAPSAQSALITASAAVQGFIARVAACDSRVLRGLLDPPCKSGLDWPFQIAGALQAFLAPRPTSGSIASDPPLVPDLPNGTHSLLEASAAILDYTSRHLFLNLGHPVVGERSVRMLGEWLEGVQAQAPQSTSAWLHHAQQLKAVCAALRSAAAAASSAGHESEAAELQAVLSGSCFGLHLTAPR